MHVFVTDIFYNQPWQRSYHKFRESLKKTDPNHAPSITVQIVKKKKEL